MTTYAPKSMALQSRARQRIPGMCQLLSKRPDQFSLGVWPGYFSKAKGARVWDLDGNEYLDMSIGGIGACVLGYADEDVDEAVREAIEGGVACSLNCPEEVELADLLCELHPWAGMARFARTGGEAMAMAVRIARAYTGRDVVAFCGYHGWHDWYLAANLADTKALDGHLLPGLSPAGVPRGLQGTALPFHFNSAEELTSIVEAHGARLAAVVLEPIRNDPPTRGFLEAVHQAAEKTGAVLISDEISAGFRLCSGGAHLQTGLQPDLAVFSKALGNGYAIAAIIGKEAPMQAAQDTFISSTNWTERVGFAAGLATIRKHQEGKAHEHLLRVGGRVQAIWREQADAYSLRIEVGGIAPLSHFSFEHPEVYMMKALFVQEMLEKGILASTSFYAMFAHTEDDVIAYRDAVALAFRHVSEAREKGKLRQRLRGAPAVHGFARLT